MCKVSVIIPVYNVERYLPACLDSVLCQTLQDVEIIAVDDASPDHCGQILDTYAKKDRRIHVIHLAENHMQGYGRNRGLEAAHGEYVYFLDSDDMIASDALAKLTQLCDEERLDGVFFDSEPLFETEELRKRHGAYPAVRTGEYPEETVTGTQLLDLFTQQDEWVVYVQRQFWRRAFLLQNGIFSPEGIEHEDEFFSFAAILLAERVRYVRETFFIRRFRADSVMTRPRKPKDFHGYFITYIRMTDFVMEHGIRSYGAEAHRMHIYGCMLDYLPQFREEADPKEWFDPEELRLYELFLAMYEAEKVAFKKRLDFWKPLKGYRTIWIYGAGRVANSAGTRLIEADYPLEGFLVSKKEGNPDVLLDRPVIAFDEYKKQKSTSVIVVAMAKQMQLEVEKLLKARNMRYFFYVGNILEGPFGEEED